VMSYHIGSTYPLINYSGVRSASRFPQLWILPAAYWDELHADAPLRFRDRAQMGPVERYLNDVPHATVHDVEDGPFDSFHAETTRHAGNRHPVAPEHAGIWAVSSQGTGKQTADMKVREGDWSVVVMNADGSLGVDADISAGANVPFLNELGWIALGSGGFALVVGIALIVAGARRPEDPTGTAPAGAAATAAAA